MLQSSLRIARSAISDTSRYRPEAGAQGRLGQRVPVAVVDIGSNSVRQVIYEGLARAPSVLFNEKVLCGLGRGIAATGRLDDNAVERAVAALQRFRALGRQAGVAGTHILATAAARDAVNGGDFIARVEALFGQPVKVLTGREEAMYSAWGIRSGFHRPEGIAGDMGGGSIELVGINGEIEGGITLPLGGLRLAEVSEGSLSTARTMVRAELKKAPVAWPGAARNFYAIGGTWRSLFKLHIASTQHPMNVIHDYAVDAESFIAFCNRLVTKGVDDFSGIEAVSRNRRPLLPYGALVLAEILKMLKAERVIASSLGVREGYLFSLLDEQERAKDSLIEAARDLSVLIARSPRHSAELAEWTGTAFERLGFEETEDEARWRIASCYLADIGWRAHPDFRAQQSVSVISNTGFVGISHEGRAYLAIASYHRYQGLGSKASAPAFAELASPRVHARARLLAALYRVLYLFSASMPGIIPRLRLERGDGDSLVLLVPADIADLCGERPNERIAQLAREAGKTIDLKVA
ncbi:MAG: Ppx/GppA phosphatase family protein [Pseudomonadota bacterium]|nr:Ppx/GppA phosphatase family protein [Pseudomonadota bacterium]